MGRGPATSASTGNYVLGECLHSGFLELHRNQQKIALLIEMTRHGSGASLPCFIGGDSAITELKHRLSPKENMSLSECSKYVNRLIDQSLDHWSTTCYDRYQRCFQNIL